MLVGIYIYTFPGFISVSHLLLGCIAVLYDVWIEDSGGPKEQRIRWESTSLHGKGQI